MKQLKLFLNLIILNYVRGQTCTPPASATIPNSSSIGICLPYPTSGKKVNQNSQLSIAWDFSTEPCNSQLLSAMNGNVGFTFGTYSCTTGKYIRQTDVFPLADNLRGSKISKFGLCEGCSQTDQHLYLVVITPNGTELSAGYTIVGLSTTISNVSDFPTPTQALTQTPTNTPTPSNQGSTIKPPSTLNPPSTASLNHMNIYSIILSITMATFAY